MGKKAAIGQDALLEKGWWKSHQWLVWRRVSQLSVLALFLIGPWFGVWVIKGNIASSLILDTVPLTDPYLLIQVLLTRHLPEITAVLGMIRLSRGGAERNDNSESLTSNQSKAK